MHILSIGTEVPLLQELSGVYTYLSKTTNYLKMALRARKVSGASEQRDPERDSNP